MATEVLLDAKFVSGFRFNCAYYGYVGKVVKQDEDSFWIQLETRCEQIPIWDLRYFRVYR